MSQLPAFDLQRLLQEHDNSIELLEGYINPALARVLRIIGFDVRYVRGQGAYLYDDRGNRYIDCLGGYAVFNVGRNHPVVREALKQAMDLDLPNLVKMGTARLSGILAKQLVELSPGDLDTVFFTNSGAEGVETAIKYARAATGRARVLHCQKGFHGLTLGALAINGNAEFREGFGPMMEHTTAVPFNDLAALERELSRNDVAGFIVEPIQGKGVNVPDDHYLPQAAELCRKHGALFIADEVQTGYGRTGRMFACEHWNVEPDILITAKGLSGGYVPVGAVLAKRWIYHKVFSNLDRCVVHSTTFGQNDLAMAAGLATLHVLRHERLVENAAAMGQRLMARLSALIGKYEMVRQVRGKGLMIALEFGPPRSMGLKMGWSLLHKLDASLFPQAILIPLLTEHRILAQVAGHHLDVIKLIPPLVLSEQDVDAIGDAFEQVVAACHRFPGPAWEVGKRLSQQAIRSRSGRGQVPAATSS
ncbi:MAG TPA: aspartate aminotransferase family protein [Phycisphaeraceae bacterium]